MLSRRPWGASFSSSSSAWSHPVSVISEQALNPVCLHLLVSLCFIVLIISQRCVLSSHESKSHQLRCAVLMMSCRHLPLSTVETTSQNIAQCLSFDLQDPFLSDGLLSVNRWNGWTLWYVLHRLEPGPHLWTSCFCFMWVLVRTHEPSPGEDDEDRRFALYWRPLLPVIVFDLRNVLDWWPSTCICRALVSRTDRNI